MSNVVAFRPSSSQMNCESSQPPEGSLLDPLRSFLKDAEFPEREETRILMLLDRRSGKRK